MADNRKTIQLPWQKGMWASGNPASVPDGYARLLENVLIRPGPRLIKRPPFTDGNLTSCVGLAVWHDNTNRVSRLVAFVRNGTNVDLYVKGTAGESWSTAFTASNGTAFSVNSAANYRDNLYYIASGEPPTWPVFGDYGRDGLPGFVYKFNGTTITTDALGSERLKATSIVPFVDRLFVGHVQAEVHNRIGIVIAYDPTAWGAVTTTLENITSGTHTIGRITPTATTGSMIYRRDIYTVPANAKATYLVFRSDLRNTSPSSEMPMTAEVYYGTQWAAGTAYTAGTIRVPTAAAGNGFRYRVKTAGTSHAATEPTWPLTVGAQVVDNTVTWICDGKDTIASTPVTLPTATDDGGFITVYTPATIPTMKADTLVGTRIKFGTDAVGTITLAAIDISLNDGLADLANGKKNYGQQLTVGRFFYPFFNRYTSGATETIDLIGDIYWTDTSDPDSIDGNNYFVLREMPGFVTALAVVGGRLVAFKRRGMWVFQGSDDPNNPLIKERFFANVGCVYEGAVTVFEDKLYFIGENGVYEYEPGGEPREICGEGMREEVIANTTAFVNYPSIAADETNRDLYVIAKSTSTHHVYDLDSRAWTRITALGGAIGAGFYTFLPANSTMYCGVSLASADLMGVHRLPLDTTGRDGATSVSVTSLCTFRPVEAQFHRREFSVDEVGIYNNVTSVQAGNTFTVGASLDGGGTFAKTNSVTIPLQSTGVWDRLPVPLRQLGQRLIIRLSHAGEAGATMFNLSDVDAVVREVGPQRTLSTPTQGSAAL